MSTTQPAPESCETCLACGERVFGVYCHHCGQKHDDCRRSITRLAAEAVANIAALDGRFMRTVQSSLLRPGKHLHQYAHGRRSPFTPPVRFFFVVTFAFFATLWVTDRNIFILQLVPEDEEELDLSDNGVTLNIMRDEEEAPPAVPAGVVALTPDEDLEELRLATADVREEVRAVLEEEGVDVPAFLRDVAGEPSPEVTIGDDPPAEDSASQEPVPGVVDGFGEEVQAAAEEAQAAQEERVEDAAGEADEPAPEAPRIVPYGGFFLKAQDLTYTEEEKEWLRSRVQIGEGVNFLGRELTSERLADALIMTMQNPNAFNNALNEAIPVLMLLFVPLMALLGALFIRGRDALIYDHLLLAIQTHAFAFVILTLIIWTGFIVPAEAAFFAFVLGVPIYYVLGLKGAFGRGWVQSVAATIFVGFVYHSLFFIALAAAVLFSIWQIV